MNYEVQNLPFFQYGLKITVFESQNQIGHGAWRVSDYCMAMSKKQLSKQNKVKKEKAEELTRQVNSGDNNAKKKLAKLEKKIR